MIKKTLSFTIEPGDANNVEYDFECANRGAKLNLSVYNALQKIRTRLKYGQDVSDIEQETLEDIRTILEEYYLEG